MEPPFATYAEADAFLRAAGHLPADPLERPLSEAREIQHRYLDFLSADAPAVGRITNHQVPGPCGPIPVRVYHPEQPRSRTAIVFVRGGGLWAGTLNGYARTMATMCRLCGMPVCGVDYRFVPECRYPVQQQEVEAAARWLSSHGPALGVDVDGIILWGESAGASLALCAALDLNAADVAPVRGLVLLYGNFAGPRPDSRPQSAWSWRQYLGSAAAEAAARAVPLQRNLRPLPPAWLGVGDADPLLADSLALAGRLKSVGVVYELQIYPAMPHSFVMMSRILQPAATALHDAAQAAIRIAAPAGIAHFNPVSPQLGGNHARPS